MSEPGWNPTFKSESESPPGTGSEAAQDLTRGQSPAAQASGGSSFPAVDYGAGGQGQASGRKQAGDDDDLDQAEDDDNAPEDEGADDDDDSDDEPGASGGSTATRLLARLGPVVQGAGSAARQGVALARRYPRVSMASGLSAAILSAVLILQPGKGKHDTTAQIPGAAIQTTTPTQTAQADPGAPPASSSSATTADDPAPRSEAKIAALAGSELPVLPAGPDVTADKSQAKAPENGPAPLAEAKAEPAPAPDASGNALAFLPAAEQVKLTAGEGLVALPPVGAPVVSPSEKNGQGNVADPAIAPAPAPPLFPVMELAAADVKPGTPPGAAQAPAPAPVPGPGKEPGAPAATAQSAPPAPTPPPAAGKAGAIPPAGAAPAPVPAPSLSPAVAAAGKAGEHGGALDVKGAAGVAGHAASGTVAAAAVAGGAGIGVGLGAAVKAMSTGGHDQAKANDTKIISTKPAAAAVKTGDSKPLNLDPGPAHAAGLDSASHPAPLVAPVPLPVPPPARTEAAAAAALSELPTLHPTGDPGRRSEPALGGGGGSVKPGGNPEAQDRPRSSSPAEEGAPDHHKELASQGWVPIKHSGGETVRDVQREVPGLEDDAAAGTAAGTTDPNAHADKEQSFDVESPPVRKSGEGADAATARSDARSASTEGKLDTVLHRVESRENFWTISRSYYNSGRYFRALWKANSDKVPDITKLYQGTVIRIPPPEELDPAYIDPPGTRPSSSRPDGEILARHDGEADDSASGRSDPATSSRRADTPAGGGGVPIRRSSRSDVELNLPVSDAATEQASDRDRSSRGSSRSDRDAEPEIRTRDAVARPIYKVRQYDTLRTIARDTLSDPRRANEILDLNRDIIDDPGHLIVGQILELPEDARPARARSRR
jgi:nucleoid-associated protein YgaU